MLQFLVSMLVVSCMIIGGVFASVYLYRYGALERSSVQRSKFSQAVVFEAKNQEETYTTLENMKSSDSEMSSYTRRILLILVGVALLIILSLTMLMGAILH